MEWNLIGSGSVFDSDMAGLVPAPIDDSDTMTHYLAGDGSWQTLPATGLQHIEYSGILPTGGNAATLNITGFNWVADNRGWRGAQSNTDNTSAEIYVGLTWTEIINGPRSGASRYLGTGTLTDGTAWVRYGLDFIGGDSDFNTFVIFYNEDANGNPTTFDVYLDTGSAPTTQPTTNRVARRQFAGTGDNVTWHDEN